MKKDDEIALFKLAKRHYERTDGNTFPLIEIAEYLDIDYDRAGYIAKKWTRNGIIEWGVGWRYPWFTPKGKASEITRHQGFETDGEFGPCGY